MSKIKLGLDVGTNSLGWAVLEKTDKKYDFLKIKDEKGNLIPTKGSYIFPKGVNADENSKAAERRGFRSPRRRLERIIWRKIKTLRVLDEYKMCPPFEVGELSKWKNKKTYPSENKEFIEWQRTGKKNGNKQVERLKQPYYLRHLAATKERMMDTEFGRLQLGRAFYHLSQRRGYLSNSEDEQTKDLLEQFKISIIQLLETHFQTIKFKEEFDVILDANKKDKDVDTLGKKITKQLKKEINFEKNKVFILEEFDKPENLGKVLRAIGELSKEIKKSVKENKCAPTIGSYFNSIYTKINKNTRLIEKIRGRYTHRVEHYETEFNYICNKQNIEPELKEKLHKAIFYQRPLKSQKGLVAKCPLEPKRKRIAKSHPLFEEFRMWESINRIKIGRGENSKLDFLTKEEKELIKPLFLKVQDFNFSKIASVLSESQTYCYVKKAKEVFFKEDSKPIEGGIAEIFFNFSMDKKFSACPTISRLKTILGKEVYEGLSLLNTGHKNEKGKKQVSIEDIWHCLFLDSSGEKNKKKGRRDFAEKHLNLNKKAIESFQKIKITKGYGNLSKSALKKIIPFLEDGKIYSHSVFLANISKVLGRKLTIDEQKNITTQISDSLEQHKQEKLINGIVNNCISKIKDNPTESLGNNPISIQAFKNDVNTEIENWFGTTQYNKLNSSDKEKCWEKFSETAMDKSAKEVSFITSKTIPEFILKTLAQEFPNEIIDITKLYHPSAMEAYPKAHKKLGNPEISSIKNPVFNRSMHQIKRLCNELIRRGIIDKTTFVNLEVANEINSTSYRLALSRWQKEQERIREWAKKEIIETYPKECQKEINPSDTDISKYIFWKEQNHTCLYTSCTISPCDFLGGKTIFDIEHTIPRSKFNDNSKSNKTLADSEFNRKIKQDTLPAVLNVTYNGIEINKEIIILNRNEKLKSYSLKNNVPTWSVDLKSLYAEYKKYRNVAKLTTDPIQHTEVMTKAHYTKLKLNYLQDKYKNFEIEEVTNKFSNANLVDTRIIAKYARAYLNSYFDKVNVVNGKITDTLRKMWGVEREYAQKDRSNHIHHCIDAITVACVERGTVSWISKAFHKYENDYFKGNDNPKYRLKEPMTNFAEKMYNLHKEVFIYHRKIDRIKPLLDNLKKENPKKLNLRGKLNSQNPYAHIMKNEELIFVQRKPISKIKGSDIEKIIDEGIKKRLLQLADLKGWEKLMEFQVKENDNRTEKEIEHKKAIAFRIYEKVKKTDKKKEIVIQSITKDIISNEFENFVSLLKTLNDTILIDSIDNKKQENYKTKISKEITNLTRTKGLETLLKESDGVLILPEYYDEKSKRKISEMVIKKIRLKSSMSNLKDYKEIRPIDKSKFDYKRDYYFDKDSYTNYEVRIFGNLIPDQPDKKLKFSNRKSILINHYNIVKNIFEKENGVPILKIHQEDMVLVFNRNPNDEIEWHNKQDLQTRLFKIVKFDENKTKGGINQVILERHNYALGNVDYANSTSENDLMNLDGVILRKSLSTLRIIPTKIDTLGIIDLDFSKKYITLHS